MYIRISSEDAQLLQIPWDNVTVMCVPYVELTDFIQQSTAKEVDNVMIESQKTDRSGSWFLLMIPGMATKNIGVYWDKQYIFEILGHGNNKVCKRHGKNMSKK